jgi:D-3-phosphoglycerate dehydrogenase / 2-oxoglutarate reductase
MQRRITIQVHNRIADAGLNPLLHEGFRVVLPPDLAGDADGVILRSHKFGRKQFGPKLVGIARAGTGTDNIDVAYATELGIPVFYAPGANAISVRDLVALLLLMAARNAEAALKFVRERLAREDRSRYKALIEATKGDFVGHELAGKRIAVVGLGNIGRLVAEIALALGMEVCGYDPSLTDEAKEKLPPGLELADNLKVLGSCKYVTLHVPLMPTTVGLAGADMFDAMRDGTILVNTARDYVVDRVALMAAVRSGRVILYATDWPLPDMLGDPDFEDQILALPHLGASTVEAEERAAEMAASELADYLRDGNVTNAVNVPACSMNRSKGSESRLTVAHVNGAGGLEAVIAVLAVAGVKLLGLKPASDPALELAYAILDLGQPVSEEVIAEIQAIDGVLRVRQLIPA